MDEAAELPLDNCPICMCSMGPYLKEGDELARLPCRHSYHDQCLSEWVQTATSCPYCRTEFTSVEILHDPLGSVLRIYEVEPKVQVEETLGEDDGNSDFDDGVGDLASEVLYSDALIGCQICTSSEREDILMLCDSCDECYHSFCLGLERVPPGPFFCPACLINEGAQTEASGTMSIVRTVADRRRSLRRARRTRQVPRQVQYDTWRAAWQRVANRAWTRLNAELVYQPEPEAGLTAEQEVELQQWRIRMDKRPTPSTAQSRDEMSETDSQSASLWAAFEQAKNFAHPAPNHSRPRRSPSKNHNGPQIEPDRSSRSSGSGTKQKRPNRGVKRPNLDAITERPRKLPRPSAHVEESAASPQSGFLASILQDIKESGKDECPVTLLSGRTTPVLRRSRTQCPSPVSRDSSPSVSDGDPAVAAMTPASLNTGDGTENKFSKLEIAKVVSGHLKPYYKTELTKEEFTHLNRSITRRVFDDLQIVSLSEEDLETRIKKEISSELLVPD